MNLQKPYNRDEYLEFLRTFIPNFAKDIRKITAEKLQVTEEAFFLGESEELDLSIFELTHTSSSDARVSLSMDGFKLMKAGAVYRALIIYRSEGSDDWRFSLMTATPDLDEKGKVVRKLSNPRRFSFFLGPNAKIHTPYQFLIKQGSVSTFEELQKRFSLEVVNKEFYKQISEKFTQLVGGTLGTGKKQKTYKPLMKLPSQAPDSHINMEFGVRLIGRIIFCWFLREKKSANNVSLMPKSLLSLEAISNHRDYYYSVLEPVFFEVLNKKERRKEYSGEPYSVIPYLNGGLFSEHEDDYYQRHNSVQSIYHNTLVIPDKWLQEFFEILETYNFTIDENTSFDEELSIDPEMLGRIFENLLAEINPETGESARKSTGSYYTPRVIVDYMVDESLLLYLQEHTKIAEEKLRAVISYDLSDDAEYKLTEAEEKLIVQSLGKLKLLDPACGSGAFPIGALQKIVFILQQLDPDGKLWLQKQLENAHPEFRRDIEKKFSNRELNFLRKLGIIQDCIFGVDIQPIATEIARLRCFLTLIVDERINDDEKNRGIKPLPNLDFKFVTANSLIPLPKETLQTDIYNTQERIDKLKAIREDYFTANEFERLQLIKDFETAQKQLGSNSQRAIKLTDWKPFSHKVTEWFEPEWMFGVSGGFDIVIANPPYGANIDDYIELFENLYPKTSKGFKDIYKYFFNCSLTNLASKNGVVCFISPNTFFLQPRYCDLRKYLLEYKIRSLINLGEDVFEAVVPTAISLIKANKDNINNQIKFADISDASKYPGSMIDINFTKLKQNTFLKTPNNIFTENIRIKSDDEEYLENVLDFKDAGINYQRVDVGLNDKGNSDLSKRLLYEGKKEENNHFEYWKGTDINSFYISPKTNRFVRPNINLRENERVILNKEYFHYSPKLLWRQTASIPIAAIDRIGIWFGRSIQSGVIKSSFVGKISYEYLCCLLNSSYIRNIYENSVQEGGRVFPQVKLEKLKPLPVKIITLEKQAPFINIVDQILNITKSADYLDREDMQTEVKKYEQQIDKMVYELYGLTPEEIEIVESSTSSKSS